MHRCILVGYDSRNAQQEGLEMTDRDMLSPE